MILTRITKAAQAAEMHTARRNALIVEARAAGMSLRAIGEAAGLSHTAVAKIVHNASTS